MELFTGRPENTEGRLPREIRTYDFLVIIYVMADNFISSIKIYNEFIQDIL